MKKHFATIYIGMWMLYSLQGILYSRGSFISQSLLLVLIAISLYYCVYANLKYKLPSPLKILSLLLIAWTTCSLVTGMAGKQIRSYDLLKSIYMSQLPIFVFYVLGRKGLLDETYLKRWFFVFLIVALAKYYESRSIGLAEAAERVNSGEEITNNAGYIMLSLLPLLPLFHRKPILQYILLGIIMLFVLTGYKRGAIAIGAVCSVWLIVKSFRSDGVQNNGEGVINRHRVIRLFLTLSIIVLSVYYVNKLLSTSDYFNNRLAITLEGDSSGRDEIYSDFINYFFNQQNMFHFLFGNGDDATAVIGGHHAHNDWLEIAIDNGLVVIVLYAIYWISQFVLFFKGKRNSTTIMMIGLFVIIYFSKSLVSMSYFGTTIYATCALGYALANYERRESFVTNEELLRATSDEK